METKVTVKKLPAKSSGSLEDVCRLFGKSIQRQLLAGKATYDIVEKNGERFVSVTYFYMRTHFALRVGQAKNADVMFKLNEVENPVEYILALVRADIAKDSSSD